MIAALAGRLAPKLIEAAPAIGSTALSIIGSLIGSKWGEGKPEDTARIKELNDIVEREAIKRNMSKGITMEAARKQVHDEMAKEYAKASGEDPNEVKQAIGSIVGLGAGMIGGAKLGKMAGAKMGAMASEAAGAKQVADAAKAGVKVGDATSIANSDIRGMGAKTDIPSTGIRGMGAKSELPINPIGKLESTPTPLDNGEDQIAYLLGQNRRAARNTPFDELPPELDQETMLAALLGQRP